MNLNPASGICNGLNRPCLRTSLGRTDSYNNSDLASTEDAAIWFPWLVEPTDLVSSSGQHVNTKLR